MINHQRHRELWDKAIFVQALINGADGFPSLVAGKAGKGKAVLCGLGLGQDKNGRIEHMTTGDGKVLLNAIYWLVDK